MNKKILAGLLCLLLGAGVFFSARLLGTNGETPGEESAESTGVTDLLFRAEPVLEEGEMAVSFTIGSLAAGVSASLEPGDLIALFTEDKEVGCFYVPALLQAVRVITTTTSGGVAKEDVVKKEDGSFPLPVTVTVKLWERQAAELIRLEQRGTLHAALICRGDEAKAQALLASQNEVLTRPEFPAFFVPEDAGDAEDEP